MVLDFRFKALFKWHSLLLEIWTSLKTKLPMLDCLAACTFDLYYRIVWRVQLNRAKGYGKAYVQLPKN